MIPRRRERWGGASIALIGLWLTWWTWRVARTGEPFLAVGCAGPAFVVLGASLVLFPGYRSERLARGEDLSERAGAALLTPRWRAVVAVAWAASAGFWAWLRFG